LIGLAICAGLAASAAAAGWHTYHGDYALSGVSADAFASAPVRLWKTRVGTGLCSPLVGGDGRLFCIADGATVTALDLKGSNLWTRTIDEPGDAAGGQRGHASFAAPPLYVDETLLVVASETGNVYGLSPGDGKQKWVYAIGANVQGAPNYAPTGKDRPAAVFVMAQENGILHAVDAADGTKLWISEPMQRTDGHVAVGGGRVVFGNCAAAFFAVDTGTGENVSFVEVGEDREMAGGLVVAGGRAYSGNRSGSFACADLEKEELCWVNKDSAGELFTTPAVKGKHVVFCGGDTVIYGVDRATGVKTWSFETDGMTPLSPVIAGSGVVAAVNGTLYGLALADGKLQWKLEAGDEITGPAIIDGMIVVGTDDGHVVAYGN